MAADDRYDFSDDELHGIDAVACADAILKGHGLPGIRSSEWDDAGELGAALEAHNATLEEIDDVADGWREYMRDEREARAW